MLEELQTQNLVKRPKPKQAEETGQYLPNGVSAKAGLNKSISDAGWGMFTDMLQVKAACAGRVIAFVDPKYTSQVCSNCGVVRKKTTTANLICKGTLPTRQDRSVDHGESGVGDDGPRDDSQGPGEVPARR